MKFFDHLHTVLAEQGFTLRVLYNRAPGLLSDPAWAVRLGAIGIEFNARGIRDAAMLCPFIIPEFARRRPAVAVLEDLGGFPSSLQAAWWCRRNRVPFLIWGLGRIPDRRPSLLRGVLRSAIEYLYYGSAGFICYSTYAARIYKRYDRPTYVALNSSQTAPTPHELDRLRKRIDVARSQKLFGIVTIGRLIPQKSIDVLLRAAAAMDHSRLDVHIVGDGPERRNLEQLAADLQISHCVRFHGEIHEWSRKAEIFAACDIGVLPGRGGLAIAELMREGLPVITGSADGTERDLIEDGVNGYRHDGALTPAMLTELLNRTIDATAERRHDMRCAAVDTIVEKANIEVMAQAFVNALRAALNQPAPATAARASSTMC